MTNAQPVFSAEVWMYIKSTPFHSPSQYIIREKFSTREEMNAWIEKQRQADAGPADEFKAYYRIESPNPGPLIKVEFE